MSKPTSPRAPAAKSLPQQKTDFTSEGAPLPGHVGTAEPSTVHTKPSEGPDAPAKVRGRIPATPLGRGG